MKVCIHRGTREIGGTCIEIESQGKRLVLDVGLPLDTADSPELLPTVGGFREEDGSLLAVILSHAHPDHYGLAGHLLPSTIMIMGAATERILSASMLFTRSGMSFANVRHLESELPMAIGPFTITPYLTDHSAYDAYSLLIEADGERFFYSGDLRGHGRKSALFERMLKQLPSAIDVLLMEGTTIGRSSDEAALNSEQEVEDCFYEQILRTKGIVLAWASGQNIDRIVSLFKATKRARRQLILDLYTAEILRATGNPNLPQASWNGVKVFLPTSQKMQIIESERFDIVERYKLHRVYADGLANEAPRSVMLFRPSMMRDLEAADCLRDARLLYSLWRGYLKRPESRPILETLEEKKIPIVECHASGHATPADLQRFAKAFAPKKLVPIHSAASDRFTEYFEDVEMKNDGEWWAVGDGN